jgi:hypothetical protein
MGWIFERVIRAHEAEDRSRRALLLSRLRPRETMASLMLGSLSVALAIIPVAVTIIGFRGGSIPPFSEARDVLAETGSFESGYDPETKKLISIPVLVRAGRIFVPSAQCELQAFVGLVLGAIGLALSVCRQKFSWLSVLGIAFALFLLTTELAFVMFMRLVKA